MKQLPRIPTKQFIPKVPYIDFSKYTSPSSSYSDRQTKAENTPDSGIVQESSTNDQAQSTPVSQNGVIDSSLVKEESLDGETQMYSTISSNIVNNNGNYTPDVSKKRKKKKDSETESDSAGMPLVHIYLDYY